MINLLEKGFRWILLVILVLLTIIVGVWFTPFYLVFKIIISVVFAILGLLFAFILKFGGGVQ